MPVWLIAIASTAEVFADGNKADAAGDTSASTPDDTAYDLRYKLAAGDVLRYSVTHRASIRSTIDQTTQAAQTKTDSIKLWKITDVLPNGDIEVMNVVDEVHMINQLPDRDPTEFHSRRDKTPPPGYEDAARAVGVPLSVLRVTPRGKIISRQVKVRQQSVEEDGPTILRLPNEPVRIGDTWDEPFEVKVTVEGGGTKMVQTRRHHRLTAVASGIGTIQVTYQVLSPIDARIECQLVQRLMEGEVKFDIDAGRVVNQQMDIDKRILGFAGPTSSMHYVMRMEEELVPASDVAETKPQPEAPAISSDRQPPRAARSVGSAGRARSTQPGKSSRR